MSGPNRREVTIAVEALISDALRREDEAARTKRPKVAECNRQIAATVRRVANWLETDPAFGAMIGGES